MTEPGRDHAKDRLEPTIVPVRRPLADASRDESSAGPRLGPRLVLGATSVLLVAGLLVVFVYLPASVEDQAPETTPVAEVPALPEAQIPVLSEAEIAALREQAETLLAALLEQQQALVLRSAQSWGDTTWSAYERAAELGDDAFLAEDFAEAVSQYQTALDTGEALFARSEDIVAEALAAGAAALDSGDAALAASQYGLVLEIDATHAQAQRGLARAEALPAVLEAMRRGAQRQDDGELEQARAAYREAVGIDADFVSARRALEAVNALIAEREFEQIIAAGFAAIQERRFARAAESFTAALALRPQSEAARDGLVEAEQGLELDAIAMAEVRAVAFERRELWDNAIERYREALATDPTLAFAIEGLKRSQYRADLDAKLVSMLDRPRRLLTEAGFADAELVLAEAEAVREPGPKLDSQIADLKQLMALAATPISVTLLSDNETEVILYRVGELGSFASKEVELKPGDYTALGRRDGFREVRENFSVLPGADNGPVTVICVEPI
jgi:tetratricopeptide (TPR) repeat protein